MLNAVDSKRNSYRDLIVWQKSMDLVDVVYRLADEFPPIEAYALRSQITRAAVSVTTNIAEGQPRSTIRDFAHFLTMAHGSLTETETLLEIAQRRGYITPKDANVAFTLTEEIGKMLIALRNRIGWRRKSWPS